MPRRFASTIRNVAGVWLAWMAAGVFYISQDSAVRLHRNEPVPWQQLWVGWTAAMSICAAFTPAILWLGRRWPLERDRRWRHAFLHLCCASLFAFVSTAIEVPVLLALGVFPGGGRMPSLRAGFAMLLAYSFHGGVIRYGAVIALQTVISARHRAETREREALELRVRSSELAGQLTAAQLNALKMQLHPHFLFNTLGAIMVLVQQRNTREAEAMLARLSDLLRHAVDDVHTQEVPLWRELEFLRLYLSIEQIRFRDRLEVRVTVDPRASDALVPHMVLQPIVENAVRHGLGGSEDPVCIDVDAAIDGDRLRLTVSDDGPGTTATGLIQKGVGLTNTENRLAALYGDGAGLRIENRLPRGVRVTVMLPFPAACLEDAACG